MVTKKKPARARVAVAPKNAAPKMESPTFWSRFAEVHAALRAHPRIEVLEPARLAHTAPNARMLRFALAELAQKSGAPTEVFAPYAGEFFYTRLYWLGAKDASGLHPFGGEIRLQGVAALTRPFDPAPGWALFDDHPNAGDGVLTLIRPDQGRWRFGVFENGTVTPLDLDLPTYMQALLDLRGAFGWQWLFAKSNDRRARLTTLLDRVEEYFGTDTAVYRSPIGR